MGLVAIKSYQVCDLCDDTQVDVVDKRVEQNAGEALGGKHAGPLFEG